MSVPCGTYSVCVCGYMHELAYMHGMVIFIRMKEAICNSPFSWCKASSRNLYLKPLGHCLDKED